MVDMEIVERIVTASAAVVEAKELLKKRTAELRRVLKIADEYDKRRVESV